jgi:SAM-dependent methyltransferase
MNEVHLRFLASPEWARMLETDLLPWVLSAGDLGDDVLEVGPGPGLTTDLLRPRVQRLTTVELDPSLAAALSARLQGTNVTVVEADATDSGLGADRFSSATCFSMLHHIPEPRVQDRMFSEMVRVLRPGGTFLGVDSLDLEPIRLFHEDDVFVPMDPETLPARLEAAGFSNVAVDKTDFEVRFSARRP